MTTAADRREPTPYDCFLAISALGSVDPLLLQEALGTPAGFDPLESLWPLIEENLVVADDEQVRIVDSPRSRDLVGLLSLGLSWGIDYNPYFDPLVHEMIRVGYRKSFVTRAEIPRENRQAGHLSLLLQDGLILAYSYEPLRIRFVPNLFLERLADYFGIVPEPPDRRGSVDMAGTLLGELLGVRPSGSRTTQLFASVLGSSRLDDLGWGHRRLSPPQRRLKLKLMESETSLLDGRLLENDRRAHRLMREKVAGGKRLSFQLLNDYHELLMEGTGRGGRVREEPIVVRNNPAFRAAEVNQIAFHLAQLICTYERRELPTVGEILRFTAWFANELMSIHPYVDGNTRLMKLTICHLLMENRIPVDEIPPTFEAQVLTLTKGAPRRDDGAVARLLHEIVLHRINLRELELAASAPG